MQGYYLFTALFVLIGLSLIITNFENDTVFHSGKMDASGANIISADEFGLSSYEPHYDIISSEENSAF